MNGHVHVTQQCRLHGYRLGGCKCLIATGREGERFEQVDCTLSCPGRRPPPLLYSEESPAPTWDDVHVGEPDAG